MDEMSLTKKYNFPVKATGLALIISALIIGLCLLQFFYLEKWNSELHKKHLSLSLNIGRIMLLDEVLTMSARMASSTGDMQYEDRYNQFEPELDKLIRNTIGMFNGRGIDDYVKQTNRANMELVDMERYAFELIHNGRRNDASVILNSPAYLRQKLLYASGMQQTLTTLTKESEQNLNNEKYFRSAFHVFSIAGMGIILFVWVYSLRAMRRRLKEYKEMQEALETDIAERKEFEIILQESEEKYRDLFENANDLIQAVDGNGRFIYVNKKWKDVLGYTDDEIRNLNLGDIIRKDMMQHCMEIFHEIKHGVNIENVEAVFVTKNGHEIFVEGKISAAMKHGMFVSTRGIFRDVSDRKRLESQLLYAKKMEAIGQLAGGVAHGFNNILTSIIGYADLLGMKIAPGDPLKNYVDHILVSSEKAASLTRDLLTYSRKQPVNLRPQNINELFRNTEGFLLRIIADNIELKIVLPDEDLTVMVDNVQLEHLLLNLSANSIDAMPEGGTLTISARRFNLDGLFIKEYGYGKAGMYALLSITDTGTGIDENIRNRIYEPFFTTKDFGISSGLGLSIVYGIVKQFNGFIDVQSAAGKGTTFKLYLPLAEAVHEQERLS